MTRIGIVLGLVALALAGCTGDVKAPAEATVSHVAHARAGVHCSRCHAGIAEATTAAGTHLPTDDACAACHAEAHPGQADRVCTGCHVDPDITATLDAMGAALIFDHRGHLDRMKPDCVACHRGTVDPGHGTIPAMSDCAGCHDDWLRGLDCKRCHVSLVAYPIKPISHQAHAADFARRHGLEAMAGGDRCAQCHGQSFCAECHDGRIPLTAADRWPDRPDRGFIHRPGYLERHAFEARLEGPTCVGCHGVEQCRACHADAGRGPGGLSPHPPGWASPGAGPNRHADAARRDLLDCASCHSGAGAEICVTCHAVGRPGGSPHGGRRPAGDPRRDRPCTACHGGPR